MTVVCTTMAPDATKSTVDTLINELLAGGVDLRSVSLNEMKRRLATELRRGPRAVPEIGLPSVA